MLADTEVRVKDSGWGINGLPNAQNESNFKSLDHSVASLL